MGFTVKETGEDFERTPIPEGIQHGICYRIVDLGHQTNQTFHVTQHKVLFIWELPKIRMEYEKDGEQLNRPKSISKEYTASLNEKANLRKDLETWRGKAFTKEELEGFDITKILKANCNIQIIHKHKGDKTYSNISIIMPLEREKWKEPENKALYYSIEEHGRNIPAEIPDWIVNKIKASNEWNEMSSNQWDDVPPPEDDDIPF